VKRQRVDAPSQVDDGPGAQAAPAGGDEGPSPSAPAPAPAAAAAAAAAPTPAPGAADAVAGALARIASHLGNPAKFVKASGLLRQLVDQGVLTKAHRQPLFAALRAAFADPGRATDPQLRREYSKLARAAASLPAGVLGR